jgi:hypothetical protein
MIWKVIRRFFEISLLAMAFVSLGSRTFAQDNSGNVVATGIYHSEADDLLTLEKVSVLPFTDNLQGIYARPLETYFVSLVEGMHRWDYVASAGTGAILSPEELEASSDKVHQVTRGLNADGAFAARITKGPNGVNIHLSLFLTKDGLLLEQAELKDYSGFNIADLKQQMKKMFSEIVARLPYSGRVLSREGNRVTVNLGSLDGVQPSQSLSVIQVMKLIRHPRFHFLISTEKEIFGRVKILKVDDTLSFGIITTEKEKGAIQKNAKIAPLDFVTYPETGLNLMPSPEEALTQRGDSGVAFGKDAKAWKPERPPMFCEIGARMGLSRFSQNMSLSGVSTGDASNDFAPNVILDGELWVTPEWTFHARLKQGIVPVSNPRGGATPSKLNQSVSYYEALFGYRMRFGQSADAPYAEPFLGYMNYKLFADDSSPQMFSSMEYSGFKLGVKGMAPVGVNAYGVGGEFSLVIRPSLHESPFTSGASNSNSATQFGVFGFKKISAHMRIQLALDFEMYATNFSGTGTRTESATSSSQRFTTLSGGLYYMF